MDKNRAMTGNEIANYRENIRRIEELMDHPIPPGMLNMSDLSRPMSSAEIANCRENIRRMEELQFSKNHRNNNQRREISPGDFYAETAAMGGFILFGSFAAGEYTLIPLGVLLLFPTLLRLYKRFRR